MLIPFKIFRKPYHIDFKLVSKLKTCIYLLKIFLTTDKFNQTENLNWFCKIFWELSPLKMVKPVFKHRELSIVVCVNYSQIKNLGSTINKTFLV